MSLCKMCAFSIPSPDGERCGFSPPTTIMRRGRAVADWPLIPNALPVSWRCSQFVEDQGFEDDELEQYMDKEDPVLLPSVGHCKALTEDNKPCPYSATVNGLCEMHSERIEATIEKTRVVPRGGWKRKCAKITRAGTRCRLNSIPGSDFCNRHQDDYVDPRIALKAKKEKAAAKKEAKAEA